ncbi:hypothetical protein BASA50_010922 [Batrachochytrium salamandrivorans]|uniref:MIR domain-containing protein n=1 Tax=Batrachochytrium salamandrivorans TaxID=1357716 RepID=A0ABQ8EZV7_9FUNG|nr:hypothetical protein BASA62_004847 [Batrachochytrium salamandrivorans]KAH6588059.1 hypothetical protein BASA50_010922 [Batrachochytrium salamandrivorans]KAH6591418.1 hypothetical protein BASA61_004929 [Batrachochytrium salamandrivorans]KAH9252676.1 hypothetical protein BASA81_009368 [Batrachochytrium salamandrivorans]KAH9267522.1 hypothetical protein BASA83_009912 [Batrachochytrium salamandrivorans]
MLATLLGVVLIAAGVARAAESFVIEKEFESITCGSSIKLASKASGFRLHSHEVNYGTGSGQQSVTGFPKGNDPNSLFVVSSGLGEITCSRGQPVHCGQTVRLQHLNTKRFLHSHSGIQSPMSGNQEVSAFDKPDAGDNWKVECIGSKEKYWNREKSVRLVHSETKFYLGTSSRFQFQNVISGQLEVSARPSTRGDEEVWSVQEGVFFAAMEA